MTSRVSPRPDKGANAGVMNAGVMMATAIVAGVGRPVRVTIEFGTEKALAERVKRAG